MDVYDQRNIDTSAELQLMLETYQRLSLVDKPVARRVLNWLSDKLELKEEAVVAGNVSGEIDLERLAILISKLTRPTSRNLIIVALGYCRENGKSALTTRALNRLLVGLGRKLSNPTRTVTLLAQRLPPLVAVIKLGNNKQSQRSFQLTSAGWAEYQRILRGAK